MKIVLIKNLKTLGDIGEMKEVKDGYARNWLIPNRLALKLDDPKAQRITKKILFERKRKEKEMAGIKEMLAKWAAKTVVIKVRVGSTGKLFGAITASDLAKKLSTEDFMLNTKQIEMPSIKKLGEYEIPIHLGDNIKSMIKLKVEPISAKASKKK